MDDRQDSLALEKRLSAVGMVTLMDGAAQTLMG